ncbi:MAG TPA: nucleotidyltransferase family protein [Roseateles sp.]
MSASPLLQAALQDTTERLAAELRQPTTTAPDWSPWQWRIAMATAFLHGLSAQLAERLHWQGPADWQAFLAEQAWQGRLREQAIADLLARIDTAARAQGLALIGLKGSALLPLRVHAPGHRPMGDIDLLCDAGQADAADRLIQGLGYTRHIEMWKHVDYLPPAMPAEPAFGEHAGNAIRIELHTTVAERLPVRRLDITADLWRTGLAAGLQPYPSLAALMRHLLLHSAGNLSNRALRLVQLIDLARLAPRLQAADWEQALAPGSDGLPAWWAWPSLELARRHAGADLQLATQTAAWQAARAACPARLRAMAERETLTAVSLSRLAIQPLPGIEWTHSLGEAWACARQRLWPDARSRATLQQQVQGQASLRGVAWVARAPWRKALRFLRGAPPRVQTLYAVQRALDHRPVLHKAA